MAKRGTEHNCVRCRVIPFVYLLLNVWEREEVYINNETMGSNSNADTTIMTTREAAAAISNWTNTLPLMGGEYVFQSIWCNNKKESALSSISGNAPTNRSVNRPVLNTDSFEVSIRDLLKHVNDNLNLPYINTDRTPDYGIYFGDHEAYSGILRKNCFH